MSAPLQYLVCPVCHSSLVSEPDTLRCTACNRRYPIVDNIPILLADRAL